MHITKLFSLKGKCAVVIGGAGKIGFPMAEALGEAGATIFIASRKKENYQNAVKKLNELTIDAHGIELDQSDEEKVIGVIEKIKTKCKIPDILINSGCERPMKKFFKDSVESWDRSMAINSRGLFITCRAFGNAMAAQGNGCIINVTSIYGLIAPDMKIYKGSNFETEPDYPFVKGGTIMFSKYLASYYASKGVRVNCIAPGGFFNYQEEPFLSNYTNKVPLNRMAYHDDLKGVTVFLASRASDYVTGAVIPLDGGLTII